MKAMPTSLANQVRDLPAKPQALAQLQSLLQHDDVSNDDLATAILRDPALAARTLRLANSSLYGLAGRVKSVRDAIGVLGLRNLGMLLTAAAIGSQLRPAACPAFDRVAHWRHGVATGLCASALAVELRLDRDAAFTAGLLHDMGRLAMACVAGNELAKVYELHALQDESLLVLERRCFGTDHAAFGAQVAEHWHFGGAIVDAIRLHHAPPPASRPSLVDAVHVANAVVHALDLNALRNERVPALDPTVWNRLDLSDDSCLKMFERVETEVDELCDSMSL
jgi:putative nucleotidyltransferase with HDIG domain